MVATVAFRNAFVQSRHAVDSVTLTPIYLTTFDALDVTIRNYDPLVGWWIYTNNADEGTKRYMYPGSEMSFIDALLGGHRPTGPVAFPASISRLWVKVDSGVGPMEATWRVVKKYTS